MMTNTNNNENANVNTVSFESETHALRNFEINFLMGKRNRNFKSDKKYNMYFFIYDDDEAKNHVEMQFCFYGGENGYGWSKTITTPLKTLSDKAEELYQKLLEGAIE